MYFTNNGVGINELWEADGPVSGTTLVTASNIDVDPINGVFNGSYSLLLQLAT
ncbi:MAG: hypothetical protein IPM91_22525 [Bacteroidetes bacterium]|nr:hypothetical protein [Bacteroidota bacterium]